MAGKIILAFDTSSSACSVALQQGDIVKSIHQDSPMQQAKLLLPMIQKLLDECSIKLDQINAVAYGCGPGSFTGCRIASSVAQGLGFAANCPLLPISSLAAIAQAAYLSKQWTHLLVALDARVEEVYCGAYQVVKNDYVELIGMEMAGKPGELAIELLQDQNWYGVGDGWEKYGDILTNRLGFKPAEINIRQLPTAEAVLRLANVAIKHGATGIKPSEAVPVYLR